MMSCETRGIVALFNGFRLCQSESNLDHVRFMLLGKFQVLIALGLVKAARLARREIEDKMERAQRVG